MKKITFIFLCLIINYGISFCQNSDVPDVLEIRTSYSQGERISFKIATADTHTNCLVDFGDGQITEFLVDTILTNVYGTLGASQTVTIQLEGIKSFQCINNSITSINTSSAPNLEVLNCIYNNLTELDIRSNTKLKELYLERNNLVELNTYTNHELEVLDCRNNRISTLDLSNNLNLLILYCQDNLLSTIDVSSHELLQRLNCNDNTISTILIHPNWRPEIIECMNNNLVYSTLPDKEIITGFYKYAPQAPVKIEAGKTIDLSSEYNMNGYNTDYTWITQNGVNLIEDVDYTITQGITTFLNAPEDSIYCEMRNGYFPKLYSGSLKTSFVKIPLIETGSVIIANVDTEIGYYIGISVTTQDNSSVWVDYGDGNLVERPSNSTGGIKVGKMPMRFVGNNMIYIDAWHQNITDLDVTGAPDLIKIGISYNQLTELDLSNNPAIEILEVDNNSLQNLIVSNCPNLINLTCNNNLITNLDLTNSTLLEQINCSYNQLSSLIVNNHSNLIQLECNNNNIENFEFSPPENYLNCTNNRLKFSTLPIDIWHNFGYNYTPQKEIVINKTSNVVDLSSEYLIGGNSTEFIWKSTSGEMLIEGVDYAITEGITTFLQSRDDSVYCELKNETFNATTQTPLKTTATKAISFTDYEVISMTSNLEPGNYTSIYLTSTSSDNNCYVDYGDGVLFPRTYRTIDDQIRGNGAIKIYGKQLRYLICPGGELTTLDVSNAPELIGIEAYNNLLTNLDFGNNPKLGILEVQYNDLHTLDISQNYRLTYLDCRNNQLTELDFSNNPPLSELYCNHNQLTSLDLDDIYELEYLNCSDNNLENLEYSLNGWIFFVECENNRLSFSSLYPDRTVLIYGYAPQKAISIENTGGFVDLSAEYESEGFYTEYTWKTTSGYLLQEGVDYVVSDGITTFLNSLSDSVYCEMTNRNYPQISGNNSLKTINIAVPRAGIESEIATEESFAINMKTTEIQMTTDDLNPIVYTIDKTLLIKSSARTEMMVFDINGRLVVTDSELYGDKQYQIDASGIYIVKLISQGKSYTQKVVIK